MAFEAIPKVNESDLLALESINTYIHVAKNGGRLDEWVNKKNRHMELFFRVMMPYCLRGGVLLNREYMPLGVSSRNYQPDEYPCTISKMANDLFIEKLKENNLYEPGFYFFKDSTNPMAKVSTREDFLRYELIIDLLIESLEASTTQTVKQKNA